LFDVGGTIFILHGDLLRTKVNMNRSLYWFSPHFGVAGAVWQNHSACCLSNKHDGTLFPNESRAAA
jgi:hypothetical protein